MTKANIEENGKGSWMSNNVNSAVSDNNYFHGNKILTEQSLNVAADLLIMILSAVLQWCLDSAVLQYCTQCDIVQTLQKCKQ